MRSKALPNGLFNISYWLESRKRGSTDDLVIVFKRDPRAREFDVTNFLSNILSDDSSNQEYRLRFVLKVQTFQQYITNEFKETPDPELQKFDVALEQVGLLSPNGINAGYENETIYVRTQCDSTQQRGQSLFRSKEGWMWESIPED